MKYSPIDYGIKDSMESLLFSVQPSKQQRKKVQPKKNIRRREYFTEAAGEPPCGGADGVPCGFDKEQTKVPDDPELAPERATVVATVVAAPVKVGAGNWYPFPTPAQLWKYGLDHTVSDTIDKQEAVDPNETETGVSTPEINTTGSSEWSPPTDEDMDCFLHKYWETHSDVSNFVRDYGSTSGYYSTITLKDFKNNCLMADGLIDSGRVTSTNKALKVEVSEVWTTIKNRAREYIEYYLDNAETLPNGLSAYCYDYSKPELSDEDAKTAYDEDVKENSFGGIYIASSDASPAQLEYGTADPVDEPTGSKCKDKWNSWMYRRCTDDEKGATNKAYKQCKKLKGPERTKCKEDIVNCKSDPNYCVKRSGFEAFSAFVRKWDNVKLFYLGVILGIPILTFLFPPAIMISSPVFMFAAAVLPYVVYKHFFRLFGPGSAFFKALPYFIRWYFWYPIVLLISKPAKLFKTIGKAIKKFFTKSIPKFFVKLFTKQVPKLVNKIMKSILKLVKDVWEIIATSTKPVVRGIMSFVKLIIKAAETVGNAFGKAWGQMMKIIKPIENMVKNVIKSIKNAFKQVKKLEKLGKKIDKMIKKIGRIR